MDEDNSFPDKLKLHETRLKYINFANQVERELQSSIALPLVLEVARKEADEALSKLAVVDPTDTKQIITLQASIYCSRMLMDTIDGIRRRGVFATKAMYDDTLTEELPNGPEIG